MIGMHGAMLCGAIEVENVVENEVVIKNSVNENLFENTSNSPSLSNNLINLTENVKSVTLIKSFQIIENENENEKGNEKTEIGKFTYVSKLSPTPSIVPPAPAFSSPLGGDNYPGRPSAVFQLAVEASVVMISGFIIHQNTV